MNLTCCICKNEISKDAKIAKIIPIKVTQHDETDARTEYTNSDDEIYIHLNCLQCGNVPIIACRAKNIATDLRIMDITQENFVDKSKIIEPLIRNNILNF